MFKRNKRKQISAEGSFQRHFFSLIEVLIAVIILVMMMGMMLYIISAAQRSFRLQESKTVMYQKSRMIFDLVERDVRSMVTSNTLYKEIGYHVFSHNANSSVSDADYVACIVTSGDPDDSSTSRLSEVTYAFHTDLLEPNERFILRRQTINQSDGDDWNFVGTPVGWEKNLLTTSPDFETVVAGVSDFSIRFEELSGATATTGDHTSQPIRVVVNVDLFDDGMSGPEFDAVRSRHTRGFTKVFYLGHIHSR